MTKRLRFERTARSEFLRAEHGSDQIEEEEHGDQADDEVFHGGTGEDWTAGAQRTFLQNQAKAIARAKNATAIPTKTTSPVTGGRSANGKGAEFMPPG
jgi:hypothetical protein